MSLIKGSYIGMFLEIFFLRFMTSIMPHDMLLLSENLACTQKYYVLRFQKLQKTKKVLRNSGLRYKVYIPRCKEKLFFQSQFANILIIIWNVRYLQGVVSVIVFGNC